VDPQQIRPAFVYTEASSDLGESKQSSMNDLVSTLARHGYLLTFAFMFGQAMGLPLPASIAMIAAGAAIASHTLVGTDVFLAAVIALVAGDIIQFWLGRYTGWALLGVLCRLSMNPETCMLRSAESFYKRGKATLVIAKFVPGLNTMAAPLSGSMKMRFGQFILLDSAGALLYTTIYILVGYVSRDFLAATLRSFYAAGRIMEVLVAIAIIVYAGYWVRQIIKYRTYNVVPRIQVAELAARLAAGGGDKIQIVDVRSHGYYDAGAERIHGSIRIEPNHLDEEIKGLSKDAEIYLYCT
jgi:membrane protein DedA with SNARE-associated domain